MISQKELFYSYLAQTSPEPMELEIVKAEGLYLIDKKNKKYLDLISGISVSNVGHSHPEIINAVKKLICIELLTTDKKDFIFFLPIVKPTIPSVV